jgi:hypothetical protein
MGVRPIREAVDIDVGGEKGGGGGRTWSLDRATIPLALAVAWVGQLVFFGYWLGGLSGEVHTLTKNQDKGETAYVQKDVADARAAATKDQIDDLKHRVAVLECSQEGRKCRSD